MLCALCVLCGSTILLAAVERDIVIAGSHLAEHALKAGVVHYRLALLLPN